MEKLDRLGWADAITFRAYGVRVGIRVNDPKLMERIPKILPHGARLAPLPVVDILFSLIGGGKGARPGVRRFNLLYESHVQLARTLDLEQIFETLESNVRLLVAASARQRVFVHAGVVGWQGRAIVIPGRSFSGKTTLVAELVRRGAIYYSDEYALFDSRGRVHPFPKPLSIRENGTFRQKDFTVEELGGRAGKKSLPVSLVLMTHYKAGARWRPQKLSAGLGALALLSNTVSARLQPERALTTLQEVVARATVIKSTRGEATQVVESILDILNGTNSVPVLENSGKLDVLQCRV